MNWIKTHFARIALTVWIGYLVVDAALSVGKPPTTCEPFPISLPFVVLLFFGVTALFGYEVGREVEASK